MDAKHIEAEISLHLRNVNADPEQVAEYRRLLVERNEGVEDPELMRRPAFELEDRIAYRLKKLVAKLRGGAIGGVIQRLTGGRVDPYTYSVLKAIYEVERGDDLR